MKASNNNIINGGGSSSSTFSILDRNPKFIASPLKPILPADLSSSFSSSSYQFDAGRIIIKREEEEVENIRRPNKSPPPVVDDTELSIFEARNYFNDPIVHNNTNTTSHKQQQQQQEQSINVHPPHHHHHHRSSSNLQVGDGLIRVRSGSLLTPTASSEASWNSQTGLLTNPVAGALSISESSIISSSTSSSRGRKKNGGAATRWFLFRGKTCPCSGKKSVQVKAIKPSRLKDQVVDVAPPAPRTIIRMQQQESEEEEEDSTVVGNSNSNNYKCRISLGSGGGGGGFTFPDLLKNAPTNSSSTTSSPIMMKKVSRAAAAAASTIHHLDPHVDHMMKKAQPVGPNFGMPQDQDPPRDSLEVFQPSGGGSLIRKSMVINAPRPRDDGRLVLPILATSRVEDDDDKASDASSDLFEIESFSTNDHSSMASSYPIMATGRQRDSLDEARPRFSTTTANNNYNNNYYEEEEEYEPSEASVAWTVTTAAYDQASMAGCSVSASDVEEFTRLQLRLHHHLQSSSDQKSNNEQGGKRRQIRSDPSSNVVTSTGGGGGILMSCRCEKAVSVGPDPVKFHHHHPVSASRGEGGHVNGRPDHGGGGGRTSHAARLSLAFST